MKRFVYGLALIATAACASTNHATLRERFVPLVVSNHYKLDCGLYLVAGGMRHRIGFVTAHAERALILVPERLIDGGRFLHIELDPIGEMTAQPASERVVWRKGQTLALTISSILQTPPSLVSW